MRQIARQAGIIDTQQPHENLCIYDLRKKEEKKVN